PRPARPHLRAAMVPGPRGQGRRPRDRRPGLRQRGPRAGRRGRLRTHPGGPRRAHGAPRLRVERARLRRAVEVGPGEGERARRTGRTPVASEHDFDVTLEAGDYEVRIRGQMDRVEADGDGRAYVVDFKTGKQAPTAKEVERHPQLAVYQLAVREGAIDEVFDG